MRHLTPFVFFLAGLVLNSTVVLAQPTVSSVSPEHGATDVEPTLLWVNVNFSENMDQSTFGADNIWVQDPTGAHVAGSYGSNSTRWSFSPPSYRWEAETEFVVVVTTAVKAEDGTPLAAEVRTSFTTAEFTPDTTAPMVVSFEPADGAVDVPRAGVRIGVTFDEIMDQSTFGDNIWLEEEGGERVSGSFGSNSTLWSFSPDDPLPGDTTFIIYVTQDVTDFAGNRLSSAARAGFTTEPGDPDTTPPEVDHVEPANGADFIARDHPDVWVYFNEAMDEDTLRPNISLRDSELTELAVSTASGYDNLLMRPTDLLDACAVYGIYVDVGVTDAFGNHLAEEFISGFTTEPEGDDDCIPARCGDEVVDPGEACDDGDTRNSDDLPDACRSDCVEASCGDGVVDTGEDCDQTDDCTADCRYEDVPDDGSLADDPIMENELDMGVDDMGESDMGTEDDGQLGGFETSTPSPDGTVTSESSDDDEGCNQVGSAPLPPLSVLVVMCLGIASVFRRRRV